MRKSSIRNMKYCLGLLLSFVCVSVNVSGSKLLDIEAQNSVHNVFLKSIEERQEPDCVCGKGGRKRIVGGKEAEMKKYPWVVAIFWNDDPLQLMCGGAIINEKYILTASHCFPGVNAVDIVVLIGDYNIDEPDEIDSLQMSVERIIMNENYGVKTRVDSDIALVKVNGIIPFRDNIQPICLTSATADYLGKFGTAAGWGTVKFGGKGSPVMLEVELPVISDDICQSNFTINYNRDTMMCAGFLEGGKDACQGDSGGPFFMEDDDGVSIVFGIISYGRGCATPSYPGVYTRVAKFLSWIGEKTTDAHYCKRPTVTTPLPPLTCGVANDVPSKRIIGGTDVSPYHYPWTAIILSGSGRQYALECGATLISDTWLLTAASCVEPFENNVQALSVILGENDISRYEGTEVQQFVSNIWIHANYSASNQFKDNIALLSLNTPIVFTDQIRPICLPPSSWSNANLNNVQGVTTGWGWTSRGGRTASIQQEAFLRIQSRRECERFFGPLPSSAMCANTPNPDEGICNLDFGGQFAIPDTSGNYRLLGISSFMSNVGCGLGRPSGFTRVPGYLSWITSTTGIETD